MVMIGIALSGRVKTASDFLVAGRKLGFRGRESHDEEGGSVNRLEWPYPIKWNDQRLVDGIDVLVLGGGVAECTGDGHAMGWRAGVAFTMMEKSVRAEWSGDRSFPPYGTGNNHNTWYACTLVDSAGRELPWVDRDGRVLETVSERYRPAPGQKFFIKGGCESNYRLMSTRGPIRFLSMIS
jgi:hypothetical protein